MSSVTKKQGFRKKQSDGGVSLPQPRYWNQPDIFAKQKSQQAQTTLPS